MQQHLNGETQKVPKKINLSATIDGGRKMLLDQARAEMDFVREN
jgi:hypothetical protein